MNGFDNLELSTETLRELTAEEMSAVAGGQATVKSACNQMTQSPACPSGATWLRSCDPSLVNC